MPRWKPTRGRNFGSLPLIVAGVLPSDELTDEPSDFGSLRPGTRLGRYELLLPVARGGMARVWAARQHGQRGFQKLVAIKTILPHLAEEPEFERMFLDEARIASGVHHPNVCEIYELGEENRTLYLAMEWVSGDSLSRVLRANGKTEALDPRIVCRLVADACAGVHAAHELTDEDGRQLGVVHRDMSPHNILLTQDGVAKVCDFGVAKALGRLTEQTSAGQLKGKISYMSPEQVTGQPVDRRSDVFSIGCVLYEATTGERPFRGDNDFLVMQAILKNEIVPPSSILRNYPPELERIVMRALAAQPILRYPTAERMRFALEELLTKGQLVTQSNVAQVVRARIGGLMDKRRERIKQASSQDLGGGEASWDPASAPRSDGRDQRSGVKPSAAPIRAAGPIVPKTLQMAAVTPRMGTPAVTGAHPATVEDLGAVGVSSSTLPNAIPVPGIEEAEAVEPEPASLRTLAIPPQAPPSEPPTTLQPPIKRTSKPLAQTMPLGVVPMGSGSYPGLSNLDGPRSSSRTPYATSSVPVPIMHSVAPPSPTPSAPPSFESAPDEQAAPTRTGYVLAALVGLVLAVVLGGGGFYFYNTRLRPRPTFHPPPAPSPDVTASAPPPTLPSALVTATTSTAQAAPSAAPSVSASAEADAGARPRKGRVRDRDPSAPAPRESANLPDNPY